MMNPTKITFTGALASVLASLSSGGWAGEETTNPATGSPRAWGEPVMEDRFGQLLVDRLEAGFAEEQDTQVWDAQAWYGGAYHKLWLKSEGEGEQGEALESAELQALYSRTLTAFWDLQIGARHDFRPDPERSFLVLGLQGLAPYKFEVDTALFVSDEGDASLRLEAEYDLRITQRLVLQPRLELNAAFSHVPEYGLGAGVNETELGIRLRYEIRREFAPYLGVQWKKLYGETGDLAREEGEPTSVTSLVAGVRFWF